MTTQRIYSGEFWERIIEGAIRDGIPERWRTSIFDGEQQLADAFLEELDDGARVLDFGCGIGRNALPLARRGYAVSACDVAQAGTHFTLERVTEEGLEAVGIGCDGVTIDTTDASVDGVLAWSVLDHVMLADAVALSREFVRVARPGGVLLFSFDEDRSDDPESTAEVLDDGTHHYVEGRRIGMLFRPYTNEEILGLFSEGWSRLAFEGVDATVPRRGLFRRTP
jgi:2-polyprenyl-3-methyl-5-hydroxy-6-metoxy-1,4-benzoquinol methylase